MLMNKPVTKKSHWYNNVWFITVVAYLILAPTGSAIYDHTKDLPILQFILKPVNFIWDFTLKTLTFKIAVWILFLFSIILIGIVYFANKYFFNKIKIQTKAQPIVSSVLMPTAPEPFLGYNTDKFRSYVWTWNYINYGGETYGIKDLQPHCPNDNAPLMKNQGGLLCTNCGQLFNYPYQITQVARPFQYDGIISLIKDKVRNDYNKILI